MAAAVRPRFAVAGLGPATDFRPAAVPSIAGFTTAACELISSTFDRDTFFATEPARALIEVLNWLANHVLDNLMNQIVYLPGATPAQINAIAGPARNGIGNLQRAVSGAVVLAQVGALAWVPDQNNVPAQSAFEIFYEIVIAAAGANTVAAAVTAIRAANLALPWPALYRSYGYPKVFWLCTGQTAAAAPVAVVAANQTGFEHNNLENWSKAMRNFTLVPPYQTQAQLLSSLTQTNQTMLQAAWDEPGGFDRDAALMQEWNKILGLTPLAAGGPAGFTRATGQASAYTFESEAGVRARCRRCRIVYRYSVVGEPLVYNEGPFNDWRTCAEVQGHLKCVRAGMV